MKTGIPIYIIDAFTEKLFGGNPAAVCPLKAWPGDDLLQAIAAENNLSETAFFVREGSIFHLRWFTPKVEVDLCGHATLASAHVIFEHLHYEGLEIAFETKSGQLKVKKENDLLIMDFPAIKTTNVEIPDQLKESIGAAPIEVFQGSRSYIAVFTTEQEIRLLKPDFSLMLTMGMDVIATAEGDGEIDFVSRFFAPNVGIPEDPVTGSAHCALVPYWRERLDKTSFHALQVSQRGGELFCEYKGGRIIIGGKAVTYSIGNISPKI